MRGMTMQWLRAHVAARTQISPASRSDMKNRRVSAGHAIGWCFSRRFRKLASRLPSENATLAKRDEILREPPANTTCSIRRLLAPIKFTGFAALSVEILKYAESAPRS